MYAILKSLLTGLIPFPLCMGTFLLGVVLLFIKKTEKIGKIAVTFAFLSFVLFSFPFFSDILLSHFERQYPSYGVGHDEFDCSSRVKYVVVLAANHTLDRNLPVTSQFSCQGLARLIEGLRLYNKCSRTKLIFSGGKGRDTDISDAELMTKLASDLGVPIDDIIIERESRSTQDEAQLLEPILRNEKFLLVTSASHMPRAMALFRELGMDPVAAPTGHLVKRYQGNRSVMPSLSNLKKCEVAFYEIFASLKARILE